ncbi:MAG: hypothetical protein H0T39_00310 [Actinobacteria bacterium]|nr:hypothetical protein [Actinomycetota bacterium]
MRTLRLIGRGLTDTLDSLLPFVLLTLAWWVCLFLVIPAPAATVTLAAMADPRRAVDRPNWREVLGAVRRNLWRGWGVVLPPLPFVAVLLANLSFYGGRTDRWDVLVPLWTLLLLFALAVALYAFAVAGLTDATAWSATKLAGLLVVRRPGQALLVALVVLFVIAVGAVLVVPLVMFVPVLTAAVVNRVVLDGLGLPVLDPLTPTAERLVEEQQRAAASRFGP